nr:MAG TPA: hypothetical protein [Caudoviricetes sp.]
MRCRCLSVNRLAFAFLLLATQCLSLSFLFFAIASHVAAVRRLCLSKLHLASIAIAFPSFSLPFHCSSEPCFAMPLQISSILCIAFSSRFKATLCYCFAFH